MLDMLTEQQKLPKIGKYMEREYQQDTIFHENKQLLLKIGS